MEDNNISIPIFGHDLIRNTLLNDLLGKNSKEILYYAGKNIARKFKLQSTNEIESFFSKAGWGNLTVIKEGKNNMKYELTGDVINFRFQESEEPCYKLESGFIAEQFQLIYGCVAECYEQPKKRSNKVSFTVQWDKKDEII